MAGITEAQAQAHLDAWLAASLSVASNQSYTIDTGGTRRTLTRADASEIREQIKFWDLQVKSLARVASRRGRTKYVVPR